MKQRLEGCKKVEQPSAQMSLDRKQCFHQPLPLRQCYFAMSISTASNGLDKANRCRWVELRLFACVSLHLDEITHHGLMTLSLPGCSSSHRGR
jgi:hypothetical protein